MSDDMWEEESGDAVNIRDYHAGVAKRQFVIDQLIAQKDGETAKNLMKLGYIYASCAMGKKPEKKELAMIDALPNDELYAEMCYMQFSARLIPVQNVRTGALFELASQKAMADAVEKTRAKITQKVIQ